MTTTIFVCDTCAFAPGVKCDAAGRTGGEVFAAAVEAAAAPGGPGLAGAVLAGDDLAARAAEAAEPTAGEVSAGGSAAPGSPEGAAPGAVSAAGAGTPGPGAPGGDAPATGVTVRRLSCLMGCDRPCAAAIVAPGKMAYVLAGFAPGPEAARALVDYALLHGASPTGVVPFRQWPPGVKGHFHARLPSLGA